MTVKKVLENLKRMIGNEFDYNDIICAFEDYEENGVSEVMVNESSNNGYDYIAYINSSDAVEFLFTVKNDIIADVWMA